jgi:DNA-binding FadR family transcriptional regulator
MGKTVTDQAITKIKDLIISGEFAAGSKLPREADLAARLGVSRNSLREAVRALTLIGVLDARVGDGTYVTSLEPDVLLAGMGFVGDLLEATTLLEVHQVRRILEPVATALAASRLTEDDFKALEECLQQMEQAEARAPGQVDASQAFVDADTAFHRIIVGAAGNATLASIIQNLSGGMARARVWRTASEHGAVAIACQRHRDIYNALRDRDAEQASAADLIHLADGERWLAERITRGAAFDDTVDPAD